MSELLLLTSTPEPSSEILPAVALLLHTVRSAPAEAASLAGSPGADVVLVDARRDLVKAREVCRLLAGLGLGIPVLAIMTEGGLAAVTAEWGADDVVLQTAGPAELEARLRLVMGRRARLAPEAPDEIRSGDLSIDEATYTARLRTRALDLTFKEFELLKFLAQHPGRVFTRSHLLQEVWGYDYFGGTRTVDVHVRRLRAKLGPEHEALIGTVRNVGYRFVPLKTSEEGRRQHRTGAGAAQEDPGAWASQEDPGTADRAAPGATVRGRPVPDSPVPGTGEPGREVGGRDNGTRERENGMAHDEASPVTGGRAPWERTSPARADS